MIKQEHALPIKRQVQLAAISRDSAHYRAKPVSDADLALMRRIDELHLELPFAGARMLRDLLRGEGVAVGRKRMTTLMRRMAITALYRKPKSSKKAAGRTIYSYLLRTLPITGRGQLSVLDISNRFIRRSKFVRIKETLNLDLFSQSHGEREYAEIKYLEANCMGRACPRGN